MCDGGRLFYFFQVYIELPAPPPTGVEQKILGEKKKKKTISNLTLAPPKIS